MAWLSTAFGNLKSNFVKNPGSWVLCATIVWLVWALNSATSRLDGVCAVARDIVELSRGSSELYRPDIERLCVIWNFAEWP